MKKWIFALVTLAAVYTFVTYNVVLDGRVYPRNARYLAVSLPENPERLTEFTNLRQLDLHTPISRETGHKLQELLPDCDIRWALAFQGHAIPTQIPSLRLHSLSWEEAAQLEALGNLRYVDAADCRDYSQLLLLQSRHAGCHVSYTVPLGGSEWSCDDTALVPGPCSGPELIRALSRLPKVQSVDLRAAGLTHREAAMVADGLPWIDFLWTVQLGTARFPTDSRELDVSGTPLTAAEVEAVLPYLPDLEKLILCDCTIPSSQMAALAERHPDIRFVWRVKLGPLSARTDDTWFAPITKRQLIGGHDADELKYCTDMECIDLGHCWISDCEWARGMERLKYLVLADTYVRDLSPLKGLKNLAYLEIFVTKVRDYSPLLGCTGLEDLNLGYTTGDPAPISQMKWLKNLWWGGIGNVPGAAGLLREKLPDTRLVFYSGSSTGLGWRELPHYYEMRDRIGMYYMVG